MDGNLQSAGISKKRFIIILKILSYKEEREKKKENREKIRHNA